MNTSNLQKDLPYQDNAETLNPDFNQEQYANTFAQLDKEALFTFLGAFLITVLFWGSIFFTHDLDVAIWSMPLWFMLSCIGGYIVSIITVIVLVKFFMKNIILNVKRSSDINKRE